MAIKVIHEYIHAVSIHICTHTHTHAHTHTHTHTHTPCIIASNEDKLFLCLGPPFKIVPIWDATTVRDEYIHSKLRWELCSRASLWPISFHDCVKPVQYRFSHTAAAKIKTFFFFYYYYYYCCFNFPFTICVFLFSPQVPIWVSQMISGNEMQKGQEVH